MEAGIIPDSVAVSVDAKTGAVVALEGFGDQIRITVIEAGR